MSRFPTRRKLLTSLIIVTIVLTSSALLLGNQMVENQKQVINLQSQVAYYQNMTETLQTQANNLETQLSQLQNPTDNVTLTIVSNGAWHGDPLTGYPQYKFINISLQNYGNNDIGGMTLDFKVEGNTTNIDQFSIHANSNIGILHVLESKYINIQLIASTIDRTQTLSNCKLIITLMLDNNILDRQSVVIGT
jgi:hypothetical protein